MTNENVFEVASRERYRVETEFGVVGVEELWQLSLGVLDTIGVKLSKIRNESDHSLLSTKRPTQTNEFKRISVMLECIKVIIAYKEDKIAQERDKVKRKKEKEKLMEILNAKENETLANQSLEEIKKRIAELE